LGVSKGNQRNLPSCVRQWPKALAFEPGKGEAKCAEPRRMPGSANACAAIFLNDLRLLRNTRLHKQLAYQ
jgi:hypothetical protein